MDYDIITFDCYGTLIDWETGISQAIVDAAQVAGVSLERDEVVRAYHEVEPAVEAGRYRPYREVLGETTLGVARRLGWDIEPHRAHFLADSLPGWPAFDDTCNVLAALRAAGLELGILSNVDDGLLRRTLTGFPVEFDLLITAEQVGSYKPAHGHFLKARQVIGSASWLHVAQSYFHDVAPACELGIPVAWVNRKCEPPKGRARADVEVRDLEEFWRWLQKVGG